MQQLLAIVPLKNTILDEFVTIWSKTTSEVVWQKTGKIIRLHHFFFGTNHYQFLNILVLIGSLYYHWIGLRCEMKNETWQVSGRELPTALCLNSVRHTLPGTEISSVKFYNLILWFIIFWSKLFKCHKCLTAVHVHIHLTTCLNQFLSHTQ